MENKKIFYGLGEEENKMLIALIGGKGSGKTFQRDKLVTQGFCPLDFKDALLDMAEDLVGFSIRENYEQFKENIVGLTAPVERIALLQHGAPARMSAEVLRRFPAAMTGRVLLQCLGTEVMRSRDANYWADQYEQQAIKVLNAGMDVVTADYRFRNEIAAVERAAKKSGSACKFIFCDYRSPRYDATDPHESEKMAQEFLKLGYKDGDVLHLTK
jgi:hypothetical protein